DTTSYTNPSFTASSGTLAIRSGRIQSTARDGSVFILNTSEVDETGMIDVTVTVGFSSGDFPISYAGVGVFNPVTLDGLVIRFRFNEVWLWFRAADGTVTGTDFTNNTY